MDLLVLDPQVIDMANRLRNEIYAGRNPGHKQYVPTWSIESIQCIFCGGMYGRLGADVRSHF